MDEEKEEVDGWLVRHEGKWKEGRNDDGEWEYHNEDKWKNEGRMIWKGVKDMMIVCV